MRDIQIESYGGPARKSLRIVELIHDGGVVARAEKKYVYRVRRYGSLLEHQFSGLAFTDEKKKRVRIQKVLDPHTGLGRVQYSVVGSFFIKMDLEIFHVVFSNKVQIDLIKPTMAKEKAW